MKVNIKKLVPEAVVPKYAKDSDAGLDLTATSKTVVNKEGTDLEQYIEYGTGLAFEIPKGFVGLVFPRSSISNKDLILSNSVGVIDAGYRGEVKLRFTFPNLAEEDLDIPYEEYEVGDRVAQLVIMPYPDIELVEVEELSSTERGVGRHGSSGK